MKYRNKISPNEECIKSLFICVNMDKHLKHFSWFKNLPGFIQREISFQISEIINKIKTITVTVSVTNVIKMNNNSILDFQACFYYEYFGLYKKLFSSKRFSW